MTDIRVTLSPAVPFAGLPAARLLPAGLSAPAAVRGWEASLPSLGKGSGARVPTGSWRVDRGPGCRQDGFPLPGPQGLAWWQGPPGAVSAASAAHVGDAPQPLGTGTLGFTGWPGHECGDAGSPRKGLLYMCTWWASVWVPRLGARSSVMSNTSNRAGVPR